MKRLSGDEINALLRGETIIRPDPDEPPADRKGPLLCPDLWLDEQKR